MRFYPTASRVNSLLSTQLTDNDVVSRRMSGTNTN
jgi:hypothetical protein